ncbi:uncharacterized protein LOC120352662 [Nilaparvata lugens]|uniref:uncharacterized protein LOC120352662 n=1 Tax=Nilaparvata lugens TaxID=108931 RepID=UPI00193D5D41|nr:uncharacterized protein LOC120352662 [Nilaparvata lugens]
MSLRLYSLMFSMASKLHPPMITPIHGRNCIESLYIKPQRFIVSSRSYSVEPPPSSTPGVQQGQKIFVEKEIEDEKRKLAAQLIAKGIKTMEDEDKKLRIKGSKLAAMDWKTLEKNLTIWQMKIADILQQIQDMIPQSIKNKIKKR